MSKFESNLRLLAFELGDSSNLLLVENFSATEGISELFEYRINLLSERNDIDINSILNRKATLRIRLEDGTDRLIHGCVDQFAYIQTGVYQGGAKSSELTRYEARLVPNLKKAGLNRDCRIFQSKTVPEIVDSVLSAYGRHGFRFELNGQYESREYCVQYRESDLNFVLRLLEEEGISFYFDQGETHEQIVFTDIAVAFPALSSSGLVDFASSRDIDEQIPYLSDLRRSHALRAASVEVRDFNFQRPKNDLFASLSEGGAGSSSEIFEYPGEFETLASGEKIARLRLEEENVKRFDIKAVSGSRQFQAARRFRLQRHPNQSLNVDYLISQMKVNADQSGTFRANPTGFTWDVELRLLPFPIQIRPPRITPIPFVHGVQTAIVVGPPGEEIYVDEYGRVKVQFHWDRYGRDNDSSSCWIRVSQPWAGTGFGGITIPRIGQEVVVDFLEGDPDRPIITGRVYNGESMPPYALPAHKAHSGLMSRSTPGGGSSNFNGLRMNDESGAEMMEIQSEKDQSILVKNNKGETVGNNESRTVGVDRTDSVGNNETRSVGVNQQVTVGSDQSISVGSNRDDSVGSNESNKIGSNRTTNVGVADTLTVGLMRTHSVGVNEMINIGAAQEVTVGAVQIVSVGLTQLVNVGLKQKTTAGDTISLSAPTIVIKATEELTLKCGAGTISIDAAGNITIKGPLVKINT